MALYIAMAAQFFVIIGATAAFFLKMGVLTEKVENLCDGFKEVKHELHEIRDKTIILETTNLKSARKS